MDNRQFNVNGRSKALFFDAIRLAFQQRGEKTTAVAYRITHQHGLILMWCNADGKTTVLLPAAFDAEASASFVWTWLESKPEIECKGWDANADHDGDNELGWRVFCEDWGHVDHDWEAIVAVKPAYLWYGK